MTISCVTDFNKVTIKMVGCDDLVLLRPPAVTLSDWERFWGVQPYPNIIGRGPQFTQEDVRGNNERRVNNLGQETR